jgi:hypothetical protein
LKLLGGQIFPPAVKRTLFYDSVRKFPELLAIELLQAMRGNKTLASLKHSHIQRTPILEVELARQRVRTGRKGIDAPNVDVDLIRQSAVRVAPVIKVAFGQFSICVVRKQVCSFEPCR